MTLSISIAQLFSRRFTIVLQPREKIKFYKSINKNPESTSVMLCNHAVAKYLKLLKRA